MTLDDTRVSIRLGMAIGAATIGAMAIDPEVLCEVSERCVSVRVSALERPLELDEEAVAAERLCEPHGVVRVTKAKADPRAAGEADEPLGELRDRIQRHRWL